MIPSTSYYGPGCYIADTARIGERCSIGANAWIGPGVVVGNDVRIKPGAVIGGHGFGFERHGERWQPKDHPYAVLISDDVYIGANTCIDAGSWRNTMIQTGVRIDNLVHVAHNVIIQPHALVIAGAELSGSVTVGEGAWVGPKACVLQRVIIGSGALVGLGAVVTRDVEPHTTVAGNPARVIDAEQGVREEM